MNCTCGFCKMIASPWCANADHLYPVTIVQARYGGTYEGGVWLAFPVDPEVVGTTNWNGSDTACSEFYLDHAHVPIGRGGDPAEALADLNYRIRHPEDEFTAWVRHVREGK
jgi:hypothetical protein